MIVVDSSVWIARLRNIATAQTEKFDALSDMNVILLGDIILMEVLEGTQNDQHAANVRKRLEKFGYASEEASDYPHLLQTRLHLMNRL